MVKKAVKMKLYEGLKDEYKKRHSELWPELAEVLKSHGASSYSIFLDEETHILFAYLELESEELWDKVAETEVCQKWWSFMKDIMDTNPDNSPISKDLVQVFDLDQH